MSCDFSPGAFNCRHILFTHNIFKNGDTLHINPGILFLLLINSENLAVPCQYPPLEMRTQGSAVAAPLGKFWVLSLLLSLPLPIA